MEGTISLLALQLGLFAFFSFKCAALYAAMRRETALAWITGALMFGLLNLIVFAIWPSDLSEQLTTIVTTPMGLYCVAQTIRLLGNQPPPSTRFWGAIAGLTMVCVALLLAGAPFLVTMALFQATVTATPIYAMLVLRRARPRHPLDGPLLAAFAILTAVFATRWPIWILSGPADASYRAYRALPADTVLLTIGSTTSTVIAMLLVARGLSDLYSSLRDRSERDPLTRLYNRAAFDQRIEASGEAGSLVIADIDHFKAINDRYGHPVGDAVIRAFAGLLTDTGALCARVGGEEFVLWLPGIEPDAALDLAHRQRRMFQARSHPALADDHALTASFGIAWREADGSLIDAYHRADAALYRAKDAGRDRVELCPLASERRAA